MSQQINENEKRELIQVGSIQMSRKVGKLFAAIAQAQLKMKHPIKDKNVKVKTKTGGEYNYKYADLPSTLDVTRALAEVGVALIQSPGTSPGKAFVTTVLGLDDGEDGQWIGGTLGVALQDEGIQTVGGAITYIRRYGGSSMAGVASEEDDDANASQGNSTSSEPNSSIPSTTSASTTVASFNSQTQQRSFTPNPAKAEEVISEPQLKRMFAIGKTKGWGPSDIKSCLALGWAIADPAKLKRKDYDAVMKMIDSENPLAAFRRLQEASENPPSKPSQFDPLSDDIPF